MHKTVNDSRYISSEARFQERDLCLAISYAKVHSKFDASFILSLADDFALNKFLTERQEIALRRIVDSFRMWEWAEKNNLSFEDGCLKEMK